MRRSFLTGAAVILAVIAPMPAVAAAPAEDVLAIVRQSSPSGSYLAGSYAGSQRDVRAAAAFLQAALRAEPENVGLLDRTFRLVLAAGETERAIGLANRLSALDSTNRVARLALAVRSIKTRQYAAAGSSLAPDVQGDRPDIAAVVVSAWATYAAGDAGEAVRVLDKLGENEIAMYLRDLHAGLIADAGGLAAEAGKRFEAVHKMDPATYFIADAYGSWLTRAGRWDDARKVYETFLNAVPNDGRAVEALADVEARKRRPPVIRNAGQGVAEALFSFGRFANSPATSEIALIYLNLALFLQPDHELALLTLASIAEQTGQYETAIEAYEKLPVRSIYRRDAEIQAAVNLSALDRFREAQQRLETLIYRAPNDLDAYLTLGNLLHRQQRYEEAARVFTRAVTAIGEPSPEHWRLYFARAVALHASGHWPQAEADLVTAVELAPDEPVLLNYLGYSWIDRGHKLDEGLRMVQQAVAARPNDGDIVDSLGWAYYRLGRYDEAVEVLERAVEIKASSWEINDHLGDAYWHVGRRLEARYQWAHARELEPSDEARVLIERKIEEGLDPVEAELAARRAEEMANPSDLEALDLEGGADSYTVVRGDTLWKIAEKVYGDGDRYPEIIRANESLRRNPNRLVPGQSLVIPR